MTARRTLLFVPVLVLTVWVLVPSSPAQQKEARQETKWEYKTVQMSSTAGAGEIDKALNELGGEGWEIATSNFVSHVNRPGSANYVLKRPKR